MNCLEIDAHIDQNEENIGRLLLQLYANCKTGVFRYDVLPILSDLKHCNTKSEIHSYSKAYSNYKSKVLGVCVSQRVGWTADQITRDASYQIIVFMQAKICTVCTVVG